MKKNFFVLLGFIILFLVWGEFFHSVDLIANQDLTRHLKLGDIIVTTHQVPLTNLFSYTNPNFHYINSHWLSEVIFHLLSQTVNIQGLHLIMSLLATAAFCLVLFAAFKKTNILVVSFVSLLMCFILFERTQLRPEIFSFLFISLFITILFKNREKFTRWILILIPLQVLWVNMHIYFILGMLLVWMFFIEELTRKHEHNKKSKQDLIKFFILTLSVTLIAIVNPHGLQGALYPFFVFNNYGYSVGENINIFSLQQTVMPFTIIAFEITACLLFIVLWLNRKKARLIDWLLSIVFTVIAASAIRNLPLFVFAVFIPLSINLYEYFHERFSEKKQPQGRTFFISCVVIFVIFCIVGIFLLSQNGLGNSVRDPNKTAVTFFLNNNLKGPIFNTFDNGSYLIYSLYPKEKVFVDARPEAYPANFFVNTYIPMLKNPQVFETEDKRYNFNTIIFTHTDKSEQGFLFLQHIVKNPNWKMIYLDDYSVIFIKNISQNKSLIDKYAITEDSVQINNFKLNDSETLYRTALAFRKFGWLKQELKIYSYLLKINPNHCLSLKRLLFVFQKNLSEEVQELQKRYINYCQ